MTTRIEIITKACKGTYKDSGQKFAMIRFYDNKGKAGAVGGDPSNAHIKALLQRAKREGVKIRKGTYC